ncbi:MAG TPA: M3 family oligoendopeptidase [Cyclobacteriaceae bacterium]
MSDVNMITREKRKFLPEDFTVKNWAQLLPYFQDLLERKIDNKANLMNWFIDRSELESILSEDLAWRYIKMSCDTENGEKRKSFEFFVNEIEPKVAPISNDLNKKAVESPFFNEIDDSGYKIMIRNMVKQIEIFRDENIPLKTKLQTESQKFGQISGAMTIEIDGKELTLQQAAVKLQSIDRKLREEVYNKISLRRLEDREKLDDLFTLLVRLRDEIARNADFANFRDYMFASMGRFDYEPQDCFDFHESIRSEVVPLLNEQAADRKKNLSFATLKPWDKAVDILGRQALVPFTNSNELVERTIACFDALDPFLGQCLRIMREMNHLDLESRKGKAPGGYNYPLAEIGVPFIFMNATSTLRDMVTIMHEGGHAVHSFLTRKLELGDFKNPPSEVAELASMSMELISMDHWNLFFQKKEDLKRAKIEHLEQIIETLPWVATIDKFQHWIYENPTHNHDERRVVWNKIFQQFSDSITDWTGLEENRNYLWQKQLHLFEVPFYYIEYGMAQLGAIAVWKNYKENHIKGLKGYMDALKLGYTKTIPEVYAAANIKFDFSKTYISELMAFVKEELHKLKAE